MLCRADAAKAAAAKAAKEKHKNRKLLTFAEDEEEEEGEGGSGPAPAPKIRSYHDAVQDSRCGCVGPGGLPWQLRACMIDRVCHGGTSKPISLVTPCSTSNPHNTMMQFGYMPA